ncbi:MAG: hypothetical protein HY925_09725 [Elusimicrobia bacterium]|nr:hypothetical protein [Elusimicrobiota bacterium]
MVLELVLALAPSAWAAPTVPECQGMYKDEYQEQWELPRAAWDADCATGREPPDVLRLRQALFQTNCRKDFAGRQDVRLDLVDAFCAQGTAGRRRLKAQLNMPPEGLPASAIGAAAPGAPKPLGKPGDQGMGPFSESVERAKQRWGGGICMNAMVYYSLYRNYNVEQSKDPTHSDLKPYMSQVEAYYYYFAVPSRRTASPVVAWFDVVDSAFCMITDRMRGPEFDEGVKATGDDCLGAVEVDVKQAIALASKSNFDTSARLEAYLLSPGSWSYLYDRCERGIRYGMGKWCEKLLTKAQVKLASRKDLWILQNDHTQLFLDARKGKVLFTTDASIDMIHFKDTGAGQMSPGACETQRR